MRLGRGQPAVRRHPLERTRRPEQPVQEVRAARVGNEPDADEARHEARVVGGDAEVADAREREPRAGARRRSPPRSRASRARGSRARSGDTSRAAPRRCRRVSPNSVRSWPAREAAARRRSARRRAPRGPAPPSALRAAPCGARRVERVQLLGRFSVIVWTAPSRVISTSAMRGPYPRVEQARERGVVAPPSPGRRGRPRSRVVPRLLEQRDVVRGRVLAVDADARDARGRAASRRAASARPSCRAGRPSGTGCSTPAAAGRSRRCATPRSRSAAPTARSRRRTSSARRAASARSERNVSTNIRERFQPCSFFALRRYGALGVGDVEVEPVASHGEVGELPRRPRARVLPSPSRRPRCRARANTSIHCSLAGVADCTMPLCTWKAIHVKWFCLELRQRAPTGRGSSRGCRRRRPRRRRGSAARRRARSPRARLGAASTATTASASGAFIYRPLNSGGRFSTNAFSPSVASSDARAR